jgi:hypothetical protein
MLIEPNSDLNRVGNLVDIKLSCRLDVPALKNVESPLTIELRDKVVIDALTLPSILVTAPVRENVKDAAF